MSKMAEFLARVGNCQNDDDFDAIMRIVDPKAFTSEEDAGEKFNDAIGYNPIVHFDTLFLEDAFDELLTKAPYSVQETMIKERKEILKKALENMHETDAAYLTNVLVATVQAETGWFPEEDFSDLNQDVVEATSSSIDVGTLFESDIPLDEDEDIDPDEVPILDSDEEEED